MSNKYRFKINYKLSGGSLSTFVSPFESALLRNDLDAAKYWISISDINAKDKKGNTYLFYAINTGHLEIVKLLIEKKVDIYNINHEGYTALHAAANAGNLEMVQFFINLGIERDMYYSIYNFINTVDANKHTALHVAINKNMLGIIKILIENGADVNLLNNMINFNDETIARIADLIKNKNYDALAIYLVEKAFGM